MPTIPVTAADPDPLLRVEEVAELIGDIHPRTARRLIERGEIGHVRIGRLVLIRASMVQAYLDRATTSATAGRR